MNVHAVAQGSDEWFALRLGRMTASHASEIAANGTGLESYIYAMMAEKYSSAEKERYSNEHTLRGIELEPQARDAYALVNGVDVEEVGFITKGEYVGCSPDGLVGSNGGLEIKCPNDERYFRTLIKHKPDKKYWWQCQMSLLVTDRDWWDLVYYNPNFKESMTTFRIEPDKKAQDKLLHGLQAGRTLIKEIEQKYVNSSKHHQGGEPSS